VPTDPCDQAGGMIASARRTTTTAWKLRYIGWPSDFHDCRSACRNRRGDEDWKRAVAVRSEILSQVKSPTLYGIGALSRPALVSVHGCDITPPDPESRHIDSPDCAFSWMKRPIQFL
jgi:hypothetical protein